MTVNILLLYYAVMSIKLTILITIYGIDPIQGDGIANASFTSSYSQNDTVSGSALQLIRSVLDESKQRRTQVCTGNVAYCPQVPPMHTGTVRSNILMGSEMEEEAYHAVLEGCCLMQDVQVLYITILMCIYLYSMVILLLYVHILLFYLF